MDDVELALLGSKEAAKRLTDAGVLVPCRCGGHAALECECLIEHVGWGKSFLVYWVRCPDCGAETKQYREASESAIREWNIWAAAEREGVEDGQSIPRRAPRGIL